MRQSLKSVLFALAAFQAVAAFCGTSVSFLSEDRTAQGTWRGVYGGDGYVISGHGQHLPPYAAVTFTGKADHVWTQSTADVRALQRFGGINDRLSTCWFSATSFDIDITITDTLPHRLSLYACDWDSTARAQRYDLIDPSTNTVITSRTINTMNGGVWVSWTVTGSVKIRVTNTGTPNAVVQGIFFGETAFGSSVDTIWFDDATPAGAAQQGDYAWSFVTNNPAPFSGASAHQSTIAAGTHQHYFTGASNLFPVRQGDRLIAHVFLDPANPPTEIMLQWNDGTWEHRAFWGADSIPFGTTNSVSRRYMGPLPATGQWVRLEVPAGIVGLEGRDLNGIAFTIFNGRATWDAPGRTTPSVPTSITLAPTNARVLTSGTQAFSATVYDQGGQVMAPQPPASAITYSVSGGGTIDAAGLFTAGTTTGTSVVTARCGNAVGTVNVIVTALPTGVADAYLVTQNFPRSIAAPGVLRNDTDPENEALSAVLVTGPANGVLVLNSNGSFTYTPTNGFLGVDSFTYRARDPLNYLSTPTTVTLTVGLNQPPTASVTQNLSTLEDTPTTGVVMGSDPTDDPLTYFVVTPPAKGTVVFPNPLAGNFIYTPAPDSTGTDTFTLGVRDPSGAEASASTSVIVVALNDAPVAGNSSVQTGNNIALAGQLLASDVDNATLSYAVTSLPSNGTLTWNGATGQFLYTPAADFIGRDSFSFVVNDGVLGSNVGTVSILVTPGPAFESLPLLSPSMVLAGQAVLASVSAPTAVSITWDWGDGSTSSGAAQTHVWVAPGLYLVKVTATGADGVSTVKTATVFVASNLDGTTFNPNAATPPGVIGVLVGGEGAGSSAKGKGKILCNYVKREKTTYSGSLGTLGIPAGLKQADLALKPGMLSIGIGANAAVFRFDLSAKGKGKATGLPQVDVNVAKKYFRFKAQRADLTALTEALGAPQGFDANNKNATLMVPVALQIGDKLFLLMTFQVNYRHVGTSGRGDLAK